MGLLDDPKLQLLTLSLLLAVVGFLLLQPTSLVRWLQKKNYQYEVTFALYMLTPTEKFIFNSTLFLTLSLFALACILYLPNHISTISHRTWYYFAGEDALGFAADGSWPQVAGHTASKASEAVREAASGVGGLAGDAYQAAVNTVVAAQEAVTRAAESWGLGMS